ncbi:zinc-dependent alcohol dehydrogenase [Rhabdothermincola sp.]|uniref:zinc-dependent alcohol dehydrogenase n=1 Tax=Rhabdothermincola sp. TaxID=2820405 RepID=UPI002FE20B5F
MKALVFMTDPEPVPPPPAGAPRLVQHLATTPMKIEEVPDPVLLGDDWLVLRTRLAGICGSDTKQVLMDFDDAGDNPMTAFISFPQVLGHEVVADVVEVGPAVRDIAVGQRVVLNPWLSCAPRGIDPPCPACAAGDYSACWSFLDGRLAPGIHSGNSRDATGGFAEYLPAHRLMVVPVPDGIPDEVAVLADPFAVSLHAICRNPPPDGGRAVVYGAGALGTTATAILRALHPSVEVATVARWPAQAALAARLGATVFDPEPRHELIEALAGWSGVPVRRPWEGLPVLYPGHIDCIYDTVGAPETVEVGIRVLAHGGKLVQMGVSSPARFEWTPWYFKELQLVGSNAFGVEELEGRRQHAIAHYLNLVEAGRIDLSGMLTHRFRLDQWRDAFRTLIDQGSTGAIKVAFDFR